MTLCFCRGMWRRRSWFSLKGNGASRVQRKGKRPYVDLAASAISQVHATRWGARFAPDGVVGGEP